jgi:hypothetical protein
VHPLGIRKAMRLLGLASLALVLALAGCGGATPTETQSAAIPHSVAERLAAQSESIAQTWPSDPCGAAQQADDLKHAVDDAIASGEIPTVYQDELETAAMNLQNTANCTEDHGDEDEDPGNGKGEGKGHDKHDDGLTVPTDTLDTTTEDDQ